MAPMPLTTLVIRDGDVEHVLQGEVTVSGHGETMVELVVEDFRVFNDFYSLREVRRPIRIGGASGTYAVVSSIRIDGDHSSPRYVEIRFKEIEQVRPKTPRIQQIVTAPPYSPGEWVNWRQGPFDGWSSALVKDVRNEADAIGDFWVVEVAPGMSPAGTRNIMSGPGLEMCLQKKPADLSTATGAELDKLAELAGVQRRIRGIYQNDEDVRAGIQAELKSGKVIDRRYMARPMSLGYMADREDKSLSRPASGSRSDILSWIRTVPGVTSVDLMDCANCNLMKPLNISIIVDGGDPWGIDKAIDASIPFGMVLHGSESLDPKRPGRPRWFTPKTWEDWKASTRRCRIERHDGTLIHEADIHDWAVFYLFVVDNIEYEARRNGVDSRVFVLGNPMDVTYDDVKLGDLLKHDQLMREGSPLAMSLPPAWLLYQPGQRMTSDQRAAVGRHWSEQLRAKVRTADAERKASKVSVMVGLDAEDL